jgi:hypothetical protein
VTLRARPPVLPPGLLLGLAGAGLAVVLAFVLVDAEGGFTAGRVGSTA